MMHGVDIRKRLIGVTVALAALAASSQSSAARRYYIEENTDFTGNGCEVTNLNTVTSSLESYLVNQGWGGDRWTNSDTWPQDWRESCSTSYGPGGLDSSYADTEFFAVYAGHGFTSGGSLYFGYPNNSECNIFLGTHSRLGTLDGHEAAYGAYLTSCTLTENSWTSHGNKQWLQQNLGYHDSPSIQDDQPKAWFYCTKSDTNVNCWLDIMRLDQEGDDTNSPIVLSYGSNSSEAAGIRDNTKLRGQAIGLVGRSGGPSCGGAIPSFTYNYVRINNGKGPCS
jgi:hypothetical protein